METVAPLDHTDASFASGAPFLAIAEPSLLLLAFALGTVARGNRNGDAQESHCFRRRPVPGGIEPGIRRYQSRHAPQLRLMGCDGRDQEIAIVWSLSIDVIVDDDLVFGFLQLDHLAELVGLAGLALADDLGRRFEHAENLVCNMGVATEEASPGLVHHPPHQRHHPVEFCAQALQGALLQSAGRPLHASRYLLREPLRLAHHPARRIEQPPITLLQPLPIERALRALFARSRTAGVSHSGCGRAVWSRPRPRSP